MGSCCQKLTKIEIKVEKEIDVFSLVSSNENKNKIVFKSEKENEAENNKIENDLNVNNLNKENENNLNVRNDNENTLKEKFYHNTEKPDSKIKSPYLQEKSKFSDVLKFEVDLEFRGLSAEIINNLSLNISEIKSQDKSLLKKDGFLNSFEDNQEIYINFNSNLNNSNSNLYSGSIKLNQLNRVGKNFSNFTSSSKLSILNMSKLDIELKLLQEINEIRLNPLKYLEKIQNYSNLIKGDYIHIPFNNCIYKIILQDGKASFNECINSLKNLDKNMQKQNYKLKELISLDELKFNYFEKNNEKLNDTIFIEQGLEEIIKKINGTYQLRAFNYRISSIEIEAFSVLHLVDYDNYSKVIQKVILDKNTKYIGINFIKFNETEYIIYIIYAN